MGALRSAIEEITSTDPSWMSETELSAETVEVSRAVDILTHRIATLTDEVRRRGGHEAAGFRSISRWLAVTTDVDDSTAKRLAHLGRVVARHDATARMAAAGELSRSRLRILAQAASHHPEQYQEHEPMLLENARELRLRDFRRAVDYWSNCADAAAAEDETFDQAERA